jgi:hypothetical protein
MIKAIVALNRKMTHPTTNLAQRPITGIRLRKWIVVRRTTSPMTSMIRTMWIVVGEWGVTLGHMHTGRRQIQSNIVELNLLLMSQKMPIKDLPKKQGQYEWW